MKKITAVLVSIMMLFAFASLNALAQDSNPVSGKCGDNANWYYDGATSTLTVTGAGRMYDFPDGYLFNRKNRTFKNIVISDGITHIGAYAFSACYDM